MKLNDILFIIFDTNFFVASKPVRSFQFFSITYIYFFELLVFILFLVFVYNSATF